MVLGLRRRFLRVGVAAGLVLVGALAAGCGNDVTGAAASPAAPATPSASMTAMTGTTGTGAGAGATGPAMSATMLDPSATPADRIPGARSSTFVLLNTRPSGLDGVRGTAWLAIDPTAGTTLTVSATGLAPGAHYIAHLHAQPCAVDNGGPHFRFDPHGPAVAPNEVHLTLDTDSVGGVRATVTNNRPVTDAARSVVIHPVGALDKRVACADL
ncbi:Superoxide dismutase [Frankia canadensis]|uniref:Superoxide dismutase n=1 Tax=Frankia canadensis TaxID=1836972 RepID=A0A2I2L1G4_9ACTN|nr:superoxide dismutase family protein [Frankia canadensis]SNQ51762.1 Superoxide dismutase [Frankia canadensis]SOU59052.1 Superoxide dismutase [Frankia canadensis]